MSKLCPSDGPDLCEPLGALLALRKRLFSEAASVPEAASTSAKKR